jgi:hypothetical protein
MSQINTKSTDPLVKEQLTLLIERELRYRLDDILQRMQQTARDFKIGEKGDKRSSLRNLLVTATDRTASLEVIKNYIDYQTARSEDIGKILKNSHNGKRFGAALVEDLEALEQDANAILDNIEVSLEKAANKQLEQQPVVEYLAQVRSREVIDLHLKLAQLYLGYLVREHTALREAAGDNRSRTDASQQASSTSAPRPQSSNRNR